MSVIGVSCTQGNNTFDECLDCTTECINKPLRKLLFKYNAPRGKGISASMLTNQCPLCPILTIKYDIYRPIQDLHASTYGSVIHQALSEEALPTDVSEVRFKDKLGGIEYSGQIDRLDTLTNHLTDYKTKAYISAKHSVSLEHHWQVNIYRYLAELNGHKVDSASILYLDPRGWLDIAVVREEPRDVKIYLEPKLTALHDGIHNNIMPKAVIHWLCEKRTVYCPVADYCMKLERGVK